MKAPDPLERMVALMAFFFCGVLDGVGRLRLPSSEHAERNDMHISEGVLSPGVLVGVPLWRRWKPYGLKKMDYEAIPRVTLPSAAFFKVG